MQAKQELMITAREEKISNMLIIEKSKTKHSKNSVRRSMEEGNKEL